ncbi:Ig-like domain-containing protein [Vibrio ostreicida]|uniref:Ig-like domain-containing protein n=1 Tax=Vibrio ostreicida TaxID=526588 RepID=UPI000970F50D|nr:Ig-like domain-containing protein [Vibrio ostreicida]
MVKLLKEMPIVAVIILVLLLVGCSEGPSGLFIRGNSGDKVELESIEIMAGPLITRGISRLAIAKGNAQSFIAMGHYSDGSKRNITDSVDWLSAEGHFVVMTSAGMGRGVEVGLTEITASKGSIISNSLSLEVTDAVITSIQVTPASVSVAKGQSQPLIATATYSDNSASDISDSVMWEVDDKAVVQVNPAGRLTGVDVGTAMISARKEGVFSQRIEVKVTDAVMTSLQLTPASVSMAKGQSQPLIAMATYSDNTTAEVTDVVTWSAVDQNIVTITKLGVMTATGVGKVYLTASINGFTSHHVTVAVTAAEITSIQVTPALVSLAKGQSQSLTAVATYSDQSQADVSATVLWISADPQIMTVSTTGQLTGVDLGRTQVTASQGGISSHPVVAEVTSAVLTSIQVTPALVSLAKGQTQSLSAIATYSDNSVSDITQSVAWASADSSIATVELTGRLTGSGLGNTQVTATMDGIVSNTVDAEITSAIISAIQVTPASFSVAKGQLQPLTAMATYSDKTVSDISDSVAWSSSDSDIAAVTLTGLLTGLEIGTSEIMATMGNITSNRIRVTVTGAVITDIQVTPATVVVAKGQTQPLVAIATYSDRSASDVTDSVSWIADDTGIITVTPTGLLTGIEVGTTHIGATLDSVSSNRVSIEVTSAIVTSIQVTPALISIAKGRTQPLTAIATYSDRTVSDISDHVAWTSMDTSMATVDPSGLLTGIGTGTTEMTASKDGITSNRILVEITPAVIMSIDVTPASVSLAKGLGGTLTAIATYSDRRSSDVTNSVAWFSADTDFATVAANGLVIGNRVGNSDITATLDGVTSNRVPVTITDAVITSIDVTPNPVSVTKAQTQLLTATATLSDNSTLDITDSVAWFPADTGIATITSTGLLTGVGVGISEVTASKDGVTSVPARVNVTSALLTSISISPASISVAKGQSETLTAMATYSDNSHSNVTASVAWSSADTNIATVTVSGLVTGVGFGTTQVTASQDGIISNTVNVEVTVLGLQVCGHVSGNPIDDSPTGGVNNTHKSNAIGPCLKLREIVDPNDGQKKWFTSTPSLAVMTGLGYTADKSANNRGDTYAATEKELASSGPAGGVFATFRQNGNGVVLPGAGNDAQAGVGSQYDRWCTKLAALNFAGQSNWRRATFAELTTFFTHDNPDNKGVFDRFGWPTRIIYWSKDTDGVGFKTFGLRNYVFPTIDPTISISYLYAMCVSRK